MKGCSRRTERIPVPVALSWWRWTDRCCLLFPWPQGWRGAEGRRWMFHRVSSG